MKKALIPGLLGLLLLTACNMSGSVMEMDDNSSAPSDEAMVEDDTGSADEAMPPADDEDAAVDVEVDVNAST